MTTFASTLGQKLKGRLVEVYLGDFGVVRMYSQDEVTLKDVVRGVLVDGFDDVLVLEVNSPNRTNLIYINTWNVKLVMEPTEDTSITDVYHCEKDRIRK